MPTSFLFFKSGAFLSTSFFLFDMTVFLPFFEMNSRLRPCLPYVSRYRPLGQKNPSSANNPGAMFLQTFLVLAKEETPTKRKERKETSFSTWSAHFWYHRLFLSQNMLSTRVLRWFRDRQTDRERLVSFFWTPPPLSSDDGSDTFFCFVFRVANNSAVFARTRRGFLLQ